MNETPSTTGRDRRKFLKLPFRLLRESLKSQAPQTSGLPNFSVEPESTLVHRSGKLPRRTFVKLLSLAGINAAFPSLLGLLPVPKEAHAKNLRSIEAGPRNQEELEKVRRMIAEFNKEFAGLVEIATSYDPTELIHIESDEERSELKLPTVEQLVVIWQTLRRLRDHGFLTQALDEAPPPGLDRPYAKQMYFISDSWGELRGKCNCNQYEPGPEAIYILLASKEEYGPDAHFGTDMFGIPWVLVHEFVHAAHNFGEKPVSGPRPDHPWDSWEILVPGNTTSGIADPADTLLYLMQAAIPGYGGGYRTVFDFSEPRQCMVLLRNRVLLPRDQELSLFQLPGRSITYNEYIETMERYQLPPNLAKTTSHGGYYFFSERNEMIAEAVTCALIDGKTAMMTILKPAISKGLDWLYTSIFEFKETEEDSDLFFPMYWLGADKLQNHYTGSIVEYSNTWTFDEVMSRDPVAGMMITKVLEGKSKPEVIDELLEWCIEQIENVIGQEFLGLDYQGLAQFHQKDWKIFGPEYALSRQSGDTDDMPSMPTPLDEYMARQKYQQILIEWKSANQAKGLELQVD